MNTDMNSSARRSTFGILSVTAAAAFALASCAPEDTVAEEEIQVPADQTTEAAPDETTEESPAEDTTTGETTDEPTDDAAEASSDHPVYQAIDAVLSEYPDGVITAFEDENDYIEVFVYDGDTEWELEVDSSTFEIINTEDDGIDDDDRAEAETVEIEITEALQTAESESDGEPHHGELDTEDGVVVWEFEMTNDVDVYVDVITGDTVRVD